MRPTLLPGLRRLWRDARTLQLGTDPATAIVLELRRPELARVLDLLDGSRTLPRLLDEAEPLGFDAADVLDVVGTLRAAGLIVAANALVPAGLPKPAHTRLTGEAAAIGLRLRATDSLAGPDEPPAVDDPAGASRRTTRGSGRPSVRSPADVLRRRTVARVMVAGDGPLVAPLATALAGAGIGHVDPVVEGRTTAADVAVGGLRWADVSKPRAHATWSAITRVAPGLASTPVRADTIDFIVRVGDRDHPGLARRGIRVSALPRLEVTVRLGTVLVGPLVRPATSPCGGCLDLHRRDRDPAWPALAAQLATSPSDRGEPCTITTAMAGAAFAADEVLAFIDGAPLRTEAAIVEIPRPGELRRRQWSAHPRCPCRRRRGAER